MKKRTLKSCLSLLLSLSLSLSLFSLPAAAASSGEISVYLDGQRLTFDQPPVAMNGRVLVPVRAIFEALGAQVEWYQDTQTVAAQKGDTLVVMALGNSHFARDVNGVQEYFKLDQTPIALNGRTLVPVRAVSEAFDCDVQWDGTAQQVTISPTRWVHGSNAATNGYFHNGVFYYAFIYQPYIYAYDGETTRTYAAGGTPAGIVVSGNKIYYINKSNQTVTAIDMASGARETVFARLSQISDFSICGQNMVIIGSDGKTQMAYQLDLTTGAAQAIYTRPEASGLIAEKGSQFALWRNYLFVVESFSPLLSGDSSCKIRAIDVNTGTCRDLLNLTGTVTQIGLKDSSYTRRFSNVSAKFDQDNAYFNLGFSSCTDTGSSSSVPFREYYQIDLDTLALSEISQAEFDRVSDLSIPKTGEWTYGSNGSSVYRTNTQTSITETLLSGSHYYYIANDGQWVVALRAESRGAGTPTATIGYKYAELYVMDTQGNHLRTINSYTSSSNTSTPVGETDVNELPEVSCAVCGGDGMVTCPYCRGTGQGQSIYVLGMETPQSCTYCGGTGERICSGCNGSGVRSPRR